MGCPSFEWLKLSPKAESQNILKWKQNNGYKTTLNDLYSIVWIKIISLILSITLDSGIISTSDNPRVYLFKTNIRFLF